MTAALRVGYQMSDHILEIAELKRLLKIAQYERGFLQDRLDAIRENKERLVMLLDTPTTEEFLEAGGDIMDIAGRQL